MGTCCGPCCHVVPNPPVSAVPCPIVLQMCQAQQLLMLPLLLARAAAAAAPRPPALPQQHPAHLLLLPAVLRLLLRPHSAGPSCWPSSWPRGRSTPTASLLPQPPALLRLSQSLQLVLLHLAAPGWVLMSCCMQAHRRRTMHCCWEETTACRYVRLLAKISCVLPSVAVGKRLGPGVVIRSCIRACAAFWGVELDGASCAGLSSGSLKLRLHSCNSGVSSVSAPRLLC